MIPVQFETLKPPNSQKFFLFSGFCDTSQRFSVQHSGSLNRFNLHILYTVKDSSVFSKILKATFQFKNTDWKKQNKGNNSHCELYDLQIR
jgi:hypothetical protein